MNVKQGLRLASVVWAARLLIAWAATRPLVVVLTAGVSDDRFLFERGALGLLEVLRLRDDLLGPATQAALAVLFAGYWLLACVSAWATRALSPSQAVPRPPLASALPRLFGLWICVLGPGVGLSLGAAFVLGSVLEGPLGRSSTLAQSAGLWGGSALILLMLGTFGLVHDVARAQLLRDGTSVLHSIKRALSLLRRSFLRLVGTRLALALGALIVTGAAAALTGLISVDRAGAGRTWAALATHQTAAWLLASLHVLWLWRAVNADGVDAGRVVSAGTSSGDAPA